MGYIQGEGRSQGTLFPAVLDDLVPADHVCRVIDARVAPVPRTWGPGRLRTSIGGKKPAV